MKQLLTLIPVLRLYFAEKKLALLGGMLLAALTVLANVALLGVSGWFITATAIAGMMAATALAFDVFLPGAAIRLFAITRTVSRYFERLLTHDTMLAVIAATREKLFRGWSRPQAAHNLLKRPSTLLFRLTADIDALDSLYLRVMVPAGAALVTTLFCVIVLGFLSPIYAFIIGGILLLTGIIIPLAISRRAAKPMRMRVKATEALRARTIDLVSGQIDLVMSGRIEAQKSALSYADQKISDADRKLNKLDILAGAGFGIVQALLLAISVIATGLLIESKLITAPLAALSLLIILASTEPFAGLRRGALELGRTLLAAKRLSGQLEPVKGEVTDFVEPPKSSDIAVQLADISLKYQDQHQFVIDNLSLTVKSGEKIAIIGSSGAGKSTLLSLISGEMRTTAGEIYAKRSILLTQKTELFKDSLRNNLSLGSIKTDDNQLLMALHDAGLGGLMETIPEGLSTCLGEGGIGLSGGQARRLALARLFLHKADLWLLDEPTEGLDSETARDVMTRLIDNSAGHTVVMATHVAREARFADKIIEISHGRILRDAQKNTPEFDEIIQNLRTH